MAEYFGSTGETSRCQRVSGNFLEDEKGKGTQAEGEATQYRARESVWDIGWRLVALQF